MTPSQMNDNSAPYRSERPTIVQALCALAYATEVGPDAAALAHKTGLPLAAMEQIAKHMREAGLWTDTTVDRTEWYDASGQIDAKVLFHQARVACGLARRVSRESGVEYVPLCTEPEAHNQEVEGQKC